MTIEKAEKLKVELTYIKDHCGFSYEGMAVSKICSVLTEIIDTLPVKHTCDECKNCKR